GACWTHLAGAQAGEYDVIMPDARGHGKSSVPEFGYTYEDLANDVVGLMKALRLSSPVLLGHSMGGLTAAVVAARKPNLLRGLILVDPTFLTPRIQRQVFESDSANQHRRMLKKSLDELMAEGRTRHPKRSLEVLELIARARLQTSIRAFDVLMPPNPDYMQLAEAIDGQTLLVISDAGVVSPAVAAELQRANPRIQVEQIPDAGHGLHYDRPDRFAAVVGSFLRSLPALPATE
ncbi:MAG TPA: alpha/beta hydrolase, partial [Bacteroidota bacterium]|nr:alpha/beta hydrolase [Bacteroidota bacterium]